MEMMKNAPMRPTTGLRCGSRRAPLCNAATTTRRGTSSTPGGAEIVMRTLDGAPTAKPGSSNGSSYSSASSISSMSSVDLAPSNVNGNGSKPTSNGIVLARAPLGTYMPAVRAAAAEVAQGIAETRGSASVSVADAALDPSGPSATTTWTSGAASGSSSYGVAYGGGGSVVVEAEVLDRPSETDFKWAQDDYNSTQRSVDTWAFFSVFRTRLWLLDQKWSYAGGFTDAKRSERARSLAKYLLNSVLQLGPTFIKIGQLSSTRSDLFPAEFVEELTTLQDRVPAFTASKAIAIIEKDLGRPVSELFASFDSRPIAAASLGQLATLHTVACMGLLNCGTMLAVSGGSTAAAAGGGRQSGRPGGAVPGAGGGVRAAGAGRHEAGAAAGQV